MEKKRYWLKLDKNFLKSPQIKVIKNMPNGKDYIIFYLSLLLESIETIGHLRFSNLVPYNEEMLSSVTDTNVDVVRTAMKLFLELGLVEILDDGTIYMTQVAQMTGKESESAERVRQYRLRKKEEEQKQLMLHCNDDVTKSNNNKEKEEEEDKDKQSTENNEDKHKKKQQRMLKNEGGIPNGYQMDTQDSIGNDNLGEDSITNTEPSLLLVPDNSNTKELLAKYEQEFEKLWELYPNKKGKTKSLSKYILARKKGTTYEQVFNGINNYIEYIKKNKILSQYIKHGDTYFNNQCWLDEYKETQAQRTKNDEQWDLLKGVYDGTIKIN